MAAMRLPVLSRARIVDPAASRAYPKMASGSSSDGDEESSSLLKLTGTFDPDYLYELASVSVILGFWAPGIPMLGRERLVSVERACIAISEGMPISSSESPPGLKAFSALLPYFSSPASLSAVLIRFDRIMGLTFLPGGVASGGIIFRRSDITLYTSYICYLL